MLALIVASVVAFVATRPPGLRNEAGKLTDTDAALPKAHDYWQQNLVAEGYPKNTDGACHYLVDRGSGFVEDGIACGPFRRADASATDVWDIFRMNLSPARVPSAYPEDAKLATALPSGSYLAAANGREQTVNTANLKAAALPEAPASTVIPDKQFTVASADLTTAVKLPDTLLTGFGASYQVGKLQEVRKAKLTPSTGPARTVGPPKGQKLYLLTFGQAAPKNHITGTNTLTMRAGGGEVATITGRNGEQVLFTAPGKDVTIQLDADSAKQSIGLFSGKKTTDPRIESLGKKNYPVSVAQSTNVGFPRKGGSDGNSYDLDVTFKKVEVTTYDGEWAGNGKVFVTGSYDSTGLSTSPSGATYTVTCTATVSGGSFKSCDNTIIGDGLLEVTAPEADSFTISMSPTMHVRRNGSNFDVAFPARDVTLRGS